MQIAEPLRDRTRWSATGHCPIERTIELVGSRPAMLVLREAYYGTRRFDDFVARVDVSPATAAAHLRALTEAGLLQRRPYRPDGGGRTREEYVLTPAGTELFPVIVALFEWGRRHTSAAPGVELRHAECGAPLDVTVTCSRGHPVPPAAVELRPIRTRRPRSRSGPSATVDQDTH